MITKKQIVISLILIPVLLLATIISSKLIPDESSYDFKEVLVQIDKKTQKISSKTGYSCEILATYDNKQYELRNVKQDYLYSEGMLTKAYLYNNKLYADTKGIGMESPIGILYIIFLVGTFSSVVTTIVLVPRYSSQKKNQKKET